MRFAGVGALSTIGYLFLFVAWRPLLGIFGANAVAMAIATLFNTAVHRELAQGVDGHTHRGRMALVACGLYLISLSLTTVGLVVAQWLAPDVLAAEIIAITVANAAASVFRFSVLRAWVFRPASTDAAAPAPASPFALGAPLRANTMEVSR
jgi:hypothetical protein